MPDEEKLAKLRKEQAAIRSSIYGKKKGPQAAPSDKGMSVGGFVENVGDDAFDIVKGLFVNLPSAAAGAIQKYWNDPSSHSELQVTSSAINSLKDAIIEPYEKHGLKVLYHRPVTTALDALTIFSLGTGAAARTAKMSGFAKGEEMMRRLQKLPGELASRGIDKAAKVVGIDRPARRQFLQLVREEESRRLTKIASDFKQVAKKITDLDDVEAGLFHKFRTMGGSLAEVHASPKVADSLRTWREFVERWQDEFKSRGVLSDEMIDTALLKKYSFEKYGAVTKEGVEAARDAIKLSEVRPVYGPSIIEQGKAFNLDDLFKMPELARQGKVGFLERFRGGQGALTDPRKYIPKAIEAFREAEKRFRLTDRVMQNPEWVKSVGRGEAGMSEMFREGVFKRYFEDRVDHSRAVRTAEISREMKAAGKTPKEIAEAIATHADTQRRILEARNIAVSNPTIRSLLKWEFASSTNGMLRMYDAVLRLFKKSATRWNPRWYTGNVVGDAFLGTLGGARWVDATRLIAKGRLPMEAAAKVGMAGEILGTGILNKLERAVDIAGAADMAARVGLITKSIRDHFVSTGRKFELSSSTLQEVLRSTENFSDVQVAMQRLEEQIARTSAPIAKINDEIAKLSKIEDKLRQKHDKAIAALDPIYDASKMELAETRLVLTRQRIVNLQESRSAIIRDMTDDLVKRGALEAQIPGLREQVDILRTAVDYANSFIGEYLGLSGFERQVMTRIIPFYSWSKAMTMLAFRLPFIAPVKTFLWHRFGMAMWNMIGDQEMPEYTKGYVPMFARANGDLVWLKFSSFNPFGGLRMTKFGGVPIPSIAAAGEANPILSLAFRLQGGRTFFDRSTIPYGEKMVNITNGDVYEYTGRGTLKKVIPQAPLIGSIAHMFPVTQLAEDILLPYTSTEHDWIGIPKPAFKPDGTYRYPKEWLERVALLGGVPLTARKRQDFVNIERLRVYQAIRDLRKSWAKADPDERKFIEQALQDYARGEYRRIEAY